MTERNSQEPGSRTGWSTNPRGGDRMTAYLPVRITDEPRADGSVLVYLADGTALVVDEDQLLRVDPDGLRIDTPAEGLG
jgi:hypothetical protein